MYACASLSPALFRDLSFPAKMETMPPTSKKEELEKALRLLERGRHLQAKPILERLATENPEDYVILHNLGMCYSDLGLLEEALQALTKVTELAPDFPDGYVALAVAQARAGQKEAAIASLTKALELDPHNPHALRNLGGILAEKGRYTKAVELFQRALAVNPEDPRALYGLAAAHKALGNLAEADRYLKRLLESEALPELQERTKDLRREIAEIEFKKQGLRLDAVWYCLEAMEYFAGKPLDAVRRVTYEIALLGREGLDIHNPEGKYRITTLPGARSGLELLCYLYVGMARLDPKVDIGFDLSREYAAALALFHKRGPADV